MPRAMLLWLRGHWKRRRHLPAESSECKVRVGRREINRRCTQRSPLRRVAPSPVEYPAAGAQAFDNNSKAFYCIPAKPRSVDSGAVRQRIHERGDAYPGARDYVDLPQQAALLFLTEQA